MELVSDNTPRDGDAPAPRQSRGLGTPKQSPELRCIGSDAPKPSGFEMKNDPPHTAPLPEIDETTHFCNLLTLLEEARVLEDNRVCLKLAQHLTELVGYRCAGLTSRSRVTDLMLLSASISTVSDLLDEEGLL